MNIRSPLVWVLTIATIAAGGAAFWVTRARAPSIVKIGVGQPLSGPLAALGQDMLNGALMASEEINASGGLLIGDKKMSIEIIAADDKGSADEGVLVAAKLVEARVVAAVAHLNSGVSIAAAPVYAAAGIPQMSVSTKVEYTRLGLPTTLRIVANDAIQGRALSVFALDRIGGKRIAVVDDGTPYGKGLAENAAKGIAERGVPALVRRTLDDKTTSFLPLVRELADAKADVLITTLSDFQVAALMPGLAANGLSEIRILGGDTLKTDRLAYRGARTGAVYATTGVVDAAGFPNGKEFLTRFQTRFNTSPVYGAHYSYDAVYLVADALRRIGKVDTSSLLQKLKSFDGNAPVTGTMRFGPDGEPRDGAIAVYRRDVDGWRFQMSSDRW